MSVTEIVSNIFGSSLFEEVVNNAAINKDITEIQLMINLIEKYIDKISKSENIVNNDNREGRLGPKLVRLDTSSHHGLFIVSPDRLSVNAQSNFSTMRANTGIHQGKWMYEVQLGSKGVMQIGWSTAQCKFNQESGVGDVINSYAYDGNRVRKWNVSTHKYGEAWLSGDIIGSTIDMDEGTICFYRNGRNMGTAFENISMGPGIVYFPTVSLAFSENLTANFGTLPMRYPVDGYHLLEQPPMHQIETAKILFDWFHNLLLQYVKIDESENCDQMMTSRGFLACLARCILKPIGPLLAVPYVTQEIFVPFIRNLARTDSLMLFNCLDLLWTFLDQHEMKVCLETTVLNLSSVFRQVSDVPEYPEQRTILVLLNSLCQHTKTRQYLLQHVFFDKVKFANFIHVKPLEQDCLDDVVNKIWWETDPPDMSVESQKASYMRACNKIKYCISEVEALQVELLTTLLNNTDGNTVTPTSRTIFLRKFRRFVQENLLTSHTSLPITLCYFHRLLVAFRVLWDAEIDTNPVYIPCRAFCDSTINYFGIDRLGGVLSHLNKTYHNELSQLLGADHEAVTADSEDTQLNSNTHDGAIRVVGAPIISVFARVMNPINVGGSPLLERIAYVPFRDREDTTPMHLGPMDSAISLLELLDGIILFYHTTAKKQIAKVASIRDVMSEYATAMLDLKSRLESVKNLKDEDSHCTHMQLVNTIEVFDKKLTDQARHMAWVRAVVYSEEKQERLAWLLRVVMLTLKRASESGNLFSFVPEFYLDVLTDLITGLKSHIHPTVPVENIPDFKEILQDAAQFFCDHFQDPRIVNTNSKDALISTLAGFVSDPLTLKALESVSKESRLKMTSNLLKSYENRAWAQSNWILVRIWQGDGFAFRYEKRPHLSKKVGPKILSQESAFQPLKPCPSRVFQAHVEQVLLSNNQATVLFLNSLLNRLNWAFSEFIGIVQEIHNISSRPDRIFLESRQLKVCATYFDLTVALLRALEMISFVAPGVFSDFSLPSSANLLARLSQLVCQILNRTSMQTSSFQHVVLMNIPDLQTVDHFPILASVIGIILALLKDELSLPESDQIPPITNVLINEPSFQISSLYFVLGDTKNTKIKNAKPFSLLNYENDVSKAEIEMVTKMIKHLDFYRSKLPLTETPCNDDDLCTICYAYPITAIFKPCNHTSCHACIDRHLLNSRTCFFCKTIINQVVTSEGKILHEFSSDSSTQDSMESED